MTHNAAHIILSALKTPTKANGTRPLYLYIVALCIVTFVAGYLVGKF